MSRKDAPIFEEGQPKRRSASIFVGQGSQVVGMGKDLLEAFPARAGGIYAKADHILGYSLSHICHEGPKETLDKTSHAQPAIFLDSHTRYVVSHDSHELHQDKPSFTAGLSLGEYNALVAAGIMDWEDALRLLDVRGRSMQYASEVNPSGLVSLKNLGPNDEELLRSLGFDVALHNTPDQIVWGGREAAIEKASEVYGKRLRRLEVAGAFHTEAMEPALEPFVRQLENTPFEEPKIPLIGNTTATPLRTIAEIKTELVNQITKPVLWMQTQEYFDKEGIHLVYDVSEKGTLSNMLKKTVGGAVASAIVVGGITTAVIWHRHHEG